MSKKSVKLIAVSVISLMIIAPVLIMLIFKFSESNNYYISAIAIIVLSLIPFYVFFENRKIKTGEIVVVAIMISLAVGSRAVMAYIPQVKPTCALVIVAAIAFGPNIGFFVGSVSMFVSNFFFGQGMFTPFQMLGMGLVGFICGLIFHKKRYAANKVAVSIVGGITCFIVYGLTVDSCSFFMMSTDFTLESALKIYISGASFNLIHGITTAILLFFINKPMTDKFNRLRIKYGIFALE